MRVRRCVIVMLEPREEVHFELGSLMAGASGVVFERHWFALAAHLDDPVPLDSEQREALGTLSSHEWVAAEDCGLPTPLLAGLIGVGLVVTDAPEWVRYQRADDAVRAVHWWPLAAVSNRHSRWQGLDSVAAMEANGLIDAPGLKAKLGSPPPELIERAEPNRRLALPHQCDELDTQWAKRTTCRNFDVSRTLSLSLFALMLQRVLMAQIRHQVSEDFAFLKKNVPSGGGLHPTEAYLLVQRVEGVPYGLYHYHPTTHSLEPLEAPSTPLRELACKLMAGQHWFADAPVLVVLASRFARSFWKYRQHAKAHRVLLLEAGHISQAFYTSANELGLGAFVTAAVNDKDVELAFGLDPAEEGVVAICGFGWRDEQMSTTEFDPAGRVWKQAD